MISRREFCKYLAAVTAGTALLDVTTLRAVAAGTEYFTVTDLGPGLWVLSGGGGNVLLAQSFGKSVLIDAGVGVAAEELLGKVIERAGAGNCTLINTHHHGDHIGGNYLIRKGFENDVAVIGQRNLTPRVGASLDQSIRPGLLRMAEAQPDKDQLIARAEALVAADFSPTATFAVEHQIKSGETEIQLRHFGPGHTDNDAVVFLPLENILHMGDLVFHELHPYVIAEHGADVAGWQKSLGLALQLCDENTVIIPGHGAISDRTALVKMNEYFDQVRETVTAAIRDGQSREEVAALKPEIFAGRGNANVQHMALTKVFDELVAGSLPGCQPPAP